MTRRSVAAGAVCFVMLSAAACGGRNGDTTLASGYVEATNVRVVVQSRRSRGEGERDRRRAHRGRRRDGHADHDGAGLRACSARRPNGIRPSAMVALLLAGSRSEDVQQAEATAAAAASERLALERELAVCSRG